MIYRKLVLIVGLVCGLLVGCTSGPGVTIPIGYNPAVSYPSTFSVEASKTGPPATQSHIAKTLEKVLREKGLTSSQTPEVIFTLQWSADDASCDSMNANADVSCVEVSPKEQPLIRAHLILEAHETQQNQRIWRAEFRGIRRIPLQSPTLAEIETLFVPAFSEALAGYAI